MALSQCLFAIFVLAGLNRFWDPVVPTIPLQSKLHQAQVVLKKDSDTTLEISLLGYTNILYFLMEIEKFESYATLAQSSHHALASFQ